MIEYRLMTKILQIFQRNGLELEQIENALHEQIQNDIRVYVDLIKTEPKHKHDLLCKAGAYVIAKKHGFFLSLKSILGRNRLHSFNLIVGTNPIFRHPLFQYDKQEVSIEYYFSIIRDNFIISPEIIQKARSLLPQLKSLKPATQVGVSILATILSDDRPSFIRGYQIADILHIARGTIYKNLSKFFPHLAQYGLRDRDPEYFYQPLQKIQQQIIAIAKTLKIPDNIQKKAVNLSFTKINPSQISSDSINSSDFGKNVNIYAGACILAAKEIENPAYALTNTQIAKYLKSIYSNSELSMICKKVEKAILNLKKFD